MVGGTNRSRYTFLKRSAGALFLGRGDGSIDDLRQFLNQPFLATANRILPWHVLPELFHLGRASGKKLYRRKGWYIYENERRLVQHYYMITVPVPWGTAEPEKILTGAHLCIDWAELACIADVKIGGKTLYSTATSIANTGGSEVRALERPWILVKRGGIEKRVIDVNESYQATVETLRSGGWSSKQGWIQLPASSAEVPHPAAAAFAITDMTVSCRKWFEDKIGRSIGYAPIWHYIARHAHSQRLFIGGLGMNPGITRIDPWGALVEKAMSTVGLDQTLYLLERSAISIAEGVSSHVIHEIAVCTSLHLYALTGDEDMLELAKFISAYALSKAMGVGYWVKGIPGSNSGPEAMFLIDDKLVTADLSNYAKNIKENEEQLADLTSKITNISRSYVIKTNNIWFGGCRKYRSIYNKECRMTGHHEALKEAMKKIRNTVF